MNGFRFAEDIADPYYDDESSRSAEFDLLGTVGRILDPIGIVPTIGNIIGGGSPTPPPPPPRPPLPPVQVQPTGNGVATANLQTPAGNAVLRLPEPVVTREEYRQITQKLEDSINGITARLNTTQSDLQNAMRRLGSIDADTRREVASAQASTRRAIEKAQREQRSQAMTNMVISMMMQQQLQRRLEEHTHPQHSHAAPAAGQTATGSTSIGPASTTGDDNNALLFLPMMMMGTDGTGEDNNNMMMMMMMMAMSR